MYRDPRMGSFSDQDFARMMGAASQAEYLVMVADNLGTDSSSSYVNLFGELPYEIENKLNQDGESGYRVIGASSAGGGRDTGAYAWTMEKKSFAATAPDSNGAVGNGGRRQDYQSRYDFDEADRYGSRGR